MKSFFQMFKNKRKADNQREKRNAYNAAALHRLNKGWRHTNKSPDASIFKDLAVLRARSRDLAINNDYGRRFLNLVKQNVVGPDGIMLQVRSRFANGKLDEIGNNTVEEAWKEWGKKGVCTVDGLLTWHDVEKLCMETVPKDGELLIRKVFGWPDNKFRFALQLIESDHIDERLNKRRKNGNKIRMGVEFNAWRRPVAYWVLTDHPYDFMYGQGYLKTKYERIPADQILHPYVVERIGQSRGVPWMATPAERLHQLSSFEDAELIASRTSASKMGFFTSPTGDDYTGQAANEESEHEPLINVAEAGTFEELPEGIDFKPWDPQHPNNGFEQFVMAVLRGVASGLNVSYVSLANDLRGVSYSSIRQGVLEDRDAWRMLQSFLKQNLHEPIYCDWLKTSLLAGAIANRKGAPFPFETFNKFAPATRWTPRGWEWVDPAKEVSASILERQHFFNSSQRIMAARGRDFYEIADEIDDENEIVEFPDPKTEKEEKDNEEKDND